MDALNIGITGRKTGLRIEDTGERDEYGMEPMDAFFSPDVSRAEHKGSTKKGLSGSGTKRQNSRVGMSLIYFKSWFYNYATRQLDLGDIYIN